MHESGLALTVLPSPITCVKCFVIFFKYECEDLLEKQTYGEVLPDPALWTYVVHLSICFSLY